MDLSILLICIVLFGLIFDCTNGFHDVSMVVSAVIATKAMRPFAAIFLAGAFEILGATQIGGVAKTITTGLVDHHSASQLMVLSALLGAITWNLITWAIAIPSSSSFALIGGMLGGAIFHRGIDAVIWKGVVYKVLCPMILTPLIGFCIAFLAMRLIDKIYIKKTDRKEPAILKYIQIFSAGLVSFAHGLNDAQKSMGIITLGLFAGNYLKTPQTPTWVMLSCALMMGIGTGIGGMRMVRTVGYKITPLTREQGCASDLSSAGIILGASCFGMPVSTTQMIVSSVTGVGTAKGRSGVSWKLIRHIVIAWCVTLPGAALFAMLTYKLLLVAGVSNI